MQAHTHQRYRYFVLDDLGGFFSLMFDNLTQLSFLAGILVFAFKFPVDVIYTRMFPGTALGVLFGDLVYTGLAIRLARRSGRTDVTAMPLGLDTPSTLGITLLVLGPAFTSLRSRGMGEHEAAMMTWSIGMAAMVFSGLIKLALSFCGAAVQRIVPRAALLGSLAGIGLMLIGYLPLIDIFATPIVGVLSLGLVLCTLVARVPLPGRLPGVLVAVALGTLIYHLLGPGGWLGGTYARPVPRLHFALPLPTLGFLDGLEHAVPYLPLVVPFALLTVIGGVNVTESARLAGDEYSTRDILLTEAIATLIAGLSGGVAQTTPYIGQPAYKGMGCRAGYTLLTGLFIGLGGVLGYASYIVELIPRAVVAPILVFVALDIVSQAFRTSPDNHAPAVAFSLFPSIAQLIGITLKNPHILPSARLLERMTLPGKELPEALVTIVLGNGFLLTALLWGAMLAEMLDHRLRRAACYAGLMALFSFFGLTHSATTEGMMYLPWRIENGFFRAIPYQLAVSYLLLTALLLLLSPFARAKTGRPVGDHAA